MSTQGPSLPELVRWYVREHVALKRASSAKTIGWICEWWARELPAHPGAAEVHAKLSRLVRDGEISATTANMRRRVLNRCYEVGRTRWPMLINAAHVSGVPKVPEPALVVRSLYQPEQMWPKLLHALPGPEGRCFASLQRRMGLRVGEVRGLEPEHVLWNSGEVFVRQQREADQSKPGPLKTDTSVARLPIHPECIGLLRAVLAARMRSAPGGALARFVFPWWRGEQDALMRIMRDVAPLDFPKRVRGESGANAWHVLRHTYGTELVEAGMDVHEVQLAMRHSSLATTQGYVAAIRGRRVPVDSLRSLWAEQAAREAQSTAHGFSLDVKHDLAPSFTPATSLGPKGQTE